MKRVLIVSAFIVLLLTAYLVNTANSPDTGTTASVQNAAQKSEPDIAVTPNESQNQNNPPANNSSKDRSQSTTNQPVTLNQSATTPNQPTTTSNSTSNKPIQKDFPMITPSGAYIQSYNLLISWQPVEDAGYGQVTVNDLTTGKKLFQDDIRGKTSLTVPNQTTYYEGGYSGLVPTLQEGHQIEIVLESWTLSNQYYYKGVRTVTVKNFIAKPLTIVSPTNGAKINASDTILRISGPDMPLYYDVIVYDNTSTKSIPVNSGISKEYNMVGIIPGHNYTVIVRAYHDSTEPAADKPPLATTQSTFSVNQ